MSIFKVNMGEHPTVKNAKETAHEMRRTNRLHEFRPHDEIVALQIPGNDLDAAEASRQTIRDDDAALQTEIENCTDADELATLCSSFNTTPITYP